MANSINVNAGALIALQNLNATNKALEVTQTRVNTGLKVSSAKDNGAIFAIATAQRAEMGAQDAVRQSMQRGQSILDVGLAAGDTVTAALNELKGIAVALADAPKTYDATGNVTGLGDSGKKLVADFEAIVKEIHSALANANFDGGNVFKKQTTDLKVTTNTGAANNTFTLKLATDDAGADGLAFGAAAGTAGAAGTFNQATGAWAAKANATTGTAPSALTDYSVANVEAAITSFSSTLADLGTKSKSLDRQLTFVNKLQDSMETGIGNLVDADLAKESARLTALQTKQQLGVQALSIANSSSQILLSLFRS
ncbi:flagellin [Brevundimonas nasdae]|uniref:flagellin n=1 Tax=Brevundimonas nasdae TaxID=172043 RepID=UPI001912A1FA|nr:flagellin [Brevundimonas nasdae]MBK6025061.1 flagellin [Brevundimonas nasdae]MDQ0451605.1 flagellin [Brevundimonas nasdae]